MGRVMTGRHDRLGAVLAFDASRRSPRDEGMSLIEVVVAMLLLAVVSAAAASLAITSLRSVDSIDHSQTAISVATMQMEAVRSSNVEENISSGGASGERGVSGLLQGRTKADVLASWTRNADIPVIADRTYPEWDPTATSNSTKVLPFTGTTTLHNTDYHWEIAVGSCFVDSADSLAAGYGQCVTYPGYPPQKAQSNTTDPPAQAAQAWPGNVIGYTKLIRAVVIVRWYKGNGCSSANPCSYALSSIFDANRDQKWYVAD